MNRILCHPKQINISAYLTIVFLLRASTIQASLIVPGLSSVLQFLRDHYAYSLPLDLSKKFGLYIIYPYPELVLAAGLQADGVLSVYLPPLACVNHHARAVTKVRMISSRFRVRG